MKKLFYEKVELNRAKLKPVSKKVTDYGIDKCLDKLGRYKKGTINCFECGHNWQVDKHSKVCKCPECNTKISIREDYPTKDSAYFAVLDVVNDMQVVRMFLVSKHFQLKKPCLTYLVEVMQHWFDECDNFCTVSKDVYTMTQAYDSWNYTSEMKIRKTPKSYKAQLRDRIPAYKIYPKQKVLPIFKKHGFTGNTLSASPQEVLRTLVSDNRFESLMKMGQFNLALAYMMNRTDKVNRHWNSIKICQRNNYVVKDATIWLDYLDALRSLGKDLRNPMFVCPKNLKQAHDKVMTKKKNVNMAEKNLIYQKSKKKFLRLKFKQENIEISVLKDVKDFEQEGKELEHCVFKNEYFAKDKSLVLSAKVNGKRTETIEVNLERLEIVQARGFKNNPSAFHTPILNLINKNLPTIGQLIHKQA